MDRLLRILSSWVLSISSSLYDRDRHLSSSLDLLRNLSIAVAVGVVSDSDMALTGKNTSSFFMPHVLKQRCLA